MKNFTHLKSTHPVDGITAAVQQFINSKDGYRGIYIDAPRHLVYAVTLSTSIHEYEPPRNQMILDINPWDLWTDGGMPTVHEGNIEYVAEKINALWHEHYTHLAKYINRDDFAPGMMEMVEAYEHVSDSHVYDYWDICKALALCGVMYAEKLMADDVEAMPVEELEVTKNDNVSK